MIAMADVSTATLAQGTKVTGPADVIARLTGTPEPKKPAVKKPAAKATDSDTATE